MTPAGVCPVAGCPETSVGFACEAHWRMLPRFTQYRLAEAARCGWAQVGGKSHDVEWWQQRAVREIGAAVANRDRQTAHRRRAPAGVVS